jgi:hypothetical protein
MTRILDDATCGVGVEIIFGASATVECILLAGAIAVIVPGTLDPAAPRHVAP